MDDPFTEEVPTRVVPLRGGWQEYLEISRGVPHDPAELQDFLRVLLVPTGEALREAVLTLPVEPPPGHPDDPFVWSKAMEHLYDHLRGQDRLQVWAFALGRLEDAWGYSRTRQYLQELVNHGPETLREGV